LPRFKFAKTQKTIKGTQKYTIQTTFQRRIELLYVELLYVLYVELLEKNASFTILPHLKFFLLIVLCQQVHKINCF